MNKVGNDKYHKKEERLSKTRINILQTIVVIFGRISQSEKSRL